MVASPAMGTQPVPELIDLRPDERIDGDRLLAWLADEVPGCSGRLTIRQFARGKANLTYLLHVEGAGGTVEYVLRRPPRGPVAPGSHDMGREFRVLSTLWRAFPYAARAFAYCDDASVLGAPFFVMERKHGIVVQDVVPPEFGGGSDPAANRKMSEAVIDTLAELHAVDPSEAGLGDLGHPEGFLARQMQGWIERWHAAKDEEVPLAVEVAGWLGSRLPVSPDPTLLHNDWRLDNMALAEDDPGRCVAVYDWDMCTRGDPYADLGTTLASWYEDDEIPTALHPMPTASPGFMTRSQAIERYGARSGRDVSGVEWYVVFGTFKMAVILQQIYIRWRRGQTEDERFASMGASARDLLALAWGRRPH